MIAVLQPGRPAGRVTAPPSKSMAHRAVLAAGLARGLSRVRNLEYSQDVLATLNAVRQLGARVEIRSRDELGRLGEDFNAMSKEIAKASTVPDKWIPCICGALGGALGIPAMYFMADFPATDPVTAVAVGIASGLAATGVNQVIKQLGKTE